MYICYLKSLSYSRLIWFHQKLTILQVTTKKNITNYRNYRNYTTFQGRVQIIPTMLEESTFVVVCIIYG